MAQAEIDSAGSRGRPNEPFVRSVGIRNYKSIETCHVELAPLTVLVGRNGSGKSNFLDAIRLVADGLQTSLDHALRSRGGIKAVQRRVFSYRPDFAIRLDVNLKDGKTATFSFEIGSRRDGGFVVKEERLQIRAQNDQAIAAYHVREGEIAQASAANPPPAARDRLYLVNAAGLPEFREVYDSLLAMGFYNVNPEAMKELQSPDARELLHHDGSNIASVIGRLTTEEPEIAQRIKNYLAAIVPGITGVDRVALGPRETLEFQQNLVVASHPWRFYAASMSDGTLRALGTLVAVAQLTGHREPVRLVGVEEPETALHPAAAGALMDALREASVGTQIIVTTHSPELVDEIDPETDRLLAVLLKEGKTEIGLVDAASKEAIQKHLYTPGELLRMDQLQIDPLDLQRQQQLDLFGAGSGTP